MATVFQMAIFRIHTNKTISRGEGGLEYILRKYISRLRRGFLFLFRFLDYPHSSELKTNYNGNNGDLLKERNNYLFIPDIFSARKHLTAEFISFASVVMLAASLLVFSLAVLFDAPILTVITGLVSLLYFVLMIFKLWIVKNSLSASLVDFTDEQIDAITDEELPVYTILIPAKYESEVMEQIISAMSMIDYPTNKLDILVCMEDYDRETIEAFIDANPPAHFRPFIMPYVNPQTKPKTLNMAFLESRGKYVVVYDAEIIPEPNQLKKAYLAFKKYPDIAVFQTRLDHYNADDNLITKMFSIEFSFYYDMFLPGLQKLGVPVPLSGHSVHFKHDAIKEVGAWDAYNVTEDCDIGMRLFRRGYKIGLIDSISQEEATSTLNMWVRQRTRWMKGFIQTSIVHLRHPVRFAKEIGGWKNFTVFILTVPGTVVVNILNIVTWIMFVIWILYHPPAIKALYPQPILLISGLAFILGGFIFTYLNLLGAYKRERFSMVKYALLTPFYWLMLAFATVRGAIQIIIDPHSWEKTTHGTHLVKNVDAVSAV